MLVPIPVDYFLGYHIDDRKKYIGGSDIPAIMDADKYGKTTAQVIAHKQDTHSYTDISTLDHVQRGILAEPIARQIANDFLGTDFVPTFIGHSTKPYLGGNVDGYCAKSFQILEIKTTGEKSHKEFMNNKVVPSHHNVQLQFYLGLFLSHFENDPILYSEAAQTVRGVYVNYRPESMSFGMTYVDPDLDMIKSIINRADQVWDLVINK